MIRQAEVADGPRIAQIHIAAWQEAYEGLLPDDYLSGLDGELEGTRVPYDRFHRVEAAPWLQVS